MNLSDSSINTTSPEQVDEEVQVVLTGPLPLVTIQLTPAIEQVAFTVADASFTLPVVWS